MPKMIQVRHVPDDVHRTLKARAARAGMTLSDYLLRELAAASEQPTVEELVDRIRGQRPPRKPVGAAAAVRAEREGRYG